MRNSLKLYVEHLPPLPESVQEVERVYHNFDSTFEDMKRVVERDPILTADILHVANSPLYGFRRKITSVQQAVALFGKDTIRCFALNSAINETFQFDISPYGITEKQFRLALERQLALIINWQVRSNSKLLSTLAPAAFLVDIGRVLISKCLIDSDNKNALLEAIEKHEELSEVEERLCGANSIEITATVFDHWNFEAKLIGVIRSLNSIDSTKEEDMAMTAMLEAVRRAVEISGEITHKSVKSAKEIIQKYNLDLEGFERALSRVQDTRE